MDDLNLACLVHLQGLAHYGLEHVCAGDRSLVPQHGHLALCRAVQGDDHVSVTLPACGPRGSGKIGLDGSVGVKSRAG